MKIKEIIHRNIDEIKLDEYVRNFAFLRRSLPSTEEMPEYRIQNEKSKYLIAYEARRLVLSIFAVVAIVALNYAISSRVAVEFEIGMKGSGLFRAWPWNGELMQQFIDLGRMQTPEQRQDFYWLAYLCSTTNIILLIWVTWRLTVEFRRMDRLNVSKSEFIAAFRAVIILSVGCVIAFMAMKANLSVSMRFYTPSIDEHVAVYSAKKVAEICFFYIAFGVDLFVISMMTRYRKI
ncbi:membrane hypothetical protein [Mesorhizobium plurifarium]|uniref:Uncharacterized protein n=1 Tax=Mesorhizobium plurifarium TaxID=69974 RepID=A0A090EZ39_MESPL|nr:membrane hypothetical protein [Mesorhizobium plurifarium]